MCEQYDYHALAPKVREEDEVDFPKNEQEEDQKPEPKAQQPHPRGKRDSPYFVR